MPEIGPNVFLNARERLFLLNLVKAMRYVRQSRFLDSLYTKLTLAILLALSACGDDDCFVLDEKCIVVVIDDAVQATPIDGGIDSP